MYFLAGVLLALCLAHGCAAPRLFSKRMYQWISYGYTPTRKEASLEDIPAGSDIYDQLHRLNNASTVEDLHQATEAMDTFLEVAGCNIPILAVTDKERIIQACVQFYLLDRVRSCMERFLEGLSTLDVLKTIREHPAACSELFCSSDINLDMDNLIELFHPVLSPVGSNRRVKEVNALAYFHDYLVCVKDEQTRLQFSDILMYATGSRDVPPCGFETHPQLEFLSESPSCIFPMANTCSCILRLPVVHTEFDGFK